MRLVDARRLRGPTLGARGPGAIAEIALDPGETADAVEAGVRREWGRLASAVGARAAGVPAPGSARTRRFEGGIAVAVPAEIDVLMPAVDLLEAAVRRAAGERGGPTVAVLARAFAAAARPALRALARAAASRGLPFLADDDALTIGSGARGRTWPLDALPPVRSVPWRSLGAIPVALVTGTNGKTTTTRMVARIAKHAGLVPGNTSSDGTAIDEVVVDPGDNTGGESARAVLRDPRVEIAILETARGGLLRRGLAVTNVDAALITNVTADHLGEHGVLDLETLVGVKAIVGHAVKQGGWVVLGGDDPSLVRIAPSFAAKRAWFVLDPRAARAAVARKEPTFLVRRGAIVRVERGNETRIVRVADVPVTDGGRAVHNVKNALAAAALAWSLGLADAAIASGLRSFGMDDNPGRGRVETTAAGVRVVLDFGHNPAAARELYAWAAAMAGKGRVHAVLTQPGDRSDAAIADFAASVAASGIASATVWETERLFRGRAAGEIGARLAGALRERGITVRVADTEADAIRRALAGAARGDVVVVSPSLDREVPR